MKIRHGRWKLIRKSIVSELNSQDDEKFNLNFQQSIAVKYY